MLLQWLARTHLSLLARGCHFAMQPCNVSKSITVEQRTSKELSQNQEEEVGISKLDFDPGLVINQESSHLFTL